jgi:hypothetical protein
MRLWHSLATPASPPPNNTCISRRSYDPAFYVAIVSINYLQPQRCGDALLTRPVVLDAGMTQLSTSKSSDHVTPRNGNVSEVDFGFDVCHDRAFITRR